MHTSQTTAARAAFLRGLAARAAAQHNWTVRLTAALGWARLARALQANAADGLLAGAR